MFRNKGFEGQKKHTHKTKQKTKQNDYSLYSGLKNSVMVKLIFRKLEDYVRLFGIKRFLKNTFFLPWSSSRWYNPAEWVAWRELLELMSKNIAGVLSQKVTSFTN